MIDYDEDRFWCDGCVQEFVLSEYIITVDDNGHDSHFCSWNCLIGFGDCAVIDEAKSRAGAIKVHAYYTEHLAAIMAAGDALKAGDNP
jgi:hypothetical protein